MMCTRDHLKHIILSLVLFAVQIDPIECYPSSYFHQSRYSQSYSTKSYLSIDGTIATWITNPVSFLTEYHLSPVDVAGGLAFTVGLLSYATTRPPKRLIDDTTLQAIVENTYMAKQSNRGLLQCVYKATRDGWKANAFHDKVDFRGSGVVVLRTKGKTIGGYNPNGWRSTDDYTTSTTAFLFRVDAPGRIQKYKVQAGGPALFDYASAGPCFGTTDLLIGPPQAAVLGGFAGPNMENEPPGSLQLANILPGQTYDTDERWPVRGYKVRLQEVEVYCMQDEF